MELGRAPSPGELGDEEHVRAGWRQLHEVHARWLDEREAGATIPAQKLCDLAHAWWDTRLDADWRPRSRDESQAILDGLGLVGTFWQLP